VITHPFSDSLLSVGWDVLWSTLTPNLKSMFTHYEDMKGNAKCRNWDGLGVMGLPWSPAMSAFDRAHVTSYST